MSELAACQQQDIAAPLASLLNVGARLEAQLRALDVAADDGVKERKVARGRDCVRRGTGFQEQCGALRVASLASDHERRERTVDVVRDCVHRGTGFEEQCGALRVASLASDHKRRGASIADVRRQAVDVGASLDADCSAAYVIPGYGAVQGAPDVFGDSVEEVAPPRRIGGLHELYEHRRALLVSVTARPAKGQIERAVWLVDQHVNRVLALLDLAHGLERTVDRSVRNGVVELLDTVGEGRSHSQARVPRRRCHRRGELLKFL